MASPKWFPLLSHLANRINRVDYRMSKSRSQRERALFSDTARLRKGVSQRHHVLLSNDKLEGRSCHSA